MTAFDDFEAQDRLQPGEPGWWQVWGASMRDIQPGDLVMFKDEHGVTVGHEIDTIASGHSISRRATFVEGGGWCFGALQPIVLLRRETHNTLSPFCR